MILMVGGHSRKIGKSAVCAALIRAFPQVRWTAVKVTTHTHDAANVAESPHLVEELPGSEAGDSGRYLAAGAARSYCLTVPSAKLAAAAPALPRVTGGGHLLIESTRLREHLRPDLFLFVVDPAVAEWKPSARRWAREADAFVVVEREQSAAVTPDIPSGIPRFPAPPGKILSAELRDFVAARLGIR
jgi:hypothetical protein